MTLTELLKQYDLIAGVAPEGTPKYKAKELAKEYIVKAYEQGQEDIVKAVEILSTKSQEELSLLVTEMVLNKSAGWSVKLDNALEKALTQARLDERKKVIEEVAREVHGDGSCTCVGCTTIRDIFDIINDMKELNQ